VVNTPEYFANNFNGGSAQLVYNMYQLYVGFTDYGNQAKLETSQDADLHTQFEQLSGLVTNTHSLFNTLSSKSHITMVMSSILGSLKIPYLVLFLQAVQHVFFVLSQLVSIFPKKLKKNATEAVKDESAKLKKGLRDFATQMREFLATTQQEAEAELGKKKL